MQTSFRRMALSLLIAALAPATLCQAADEGAGEPSKKVYTILPIGDSITEGNGGFGNYRFPLWEKLHAAGYFAEFVGSKQRDTRIGPLQHEGYGGHIAEFFAKNIDEMYRKNPADIVLIHSGHNHTIEEKPVPGIVEATRTIITKILAINPKAKILLAQVITSGKLPKYSYIPELNQELAKLADQIDPQHTNVIMVDQASGWDPIKDTNPDKVHPSDLGGQKMAQVWLEAIAKVLPSPGPQQMPEIVKYKSIKSTSLNLHVFKPQSAKAGDKRAAVIYFFGGGWSRGTPIQFYAECRQLAAAGMVAISADYRISSLNKTTPFESLADAKSAVRWVRAHAKELGIDPNRIATAGSSAGGHLAAATAICPGFDEPTEDAAVSSVPNAMVLLAPVINNGPDGFGYDSVKDRYKEFSPFHALSKQAPPAMIYIGDHDKNTPLPIIQDFDKRLRDLGGRSDLHVLVGFQHGLFAYREPPTKECLQIRADTLAFFKSLGYLNPAN